MKIRAWIQAFRPAAAVNVLLPLFFGYYLVAAEAWHFTSFILGAVGLLAFGLFFQGAIVFLNDYADREADKENTTPTPFSGGSRVLQENLLKPQQLKVAGIVCIFGTLLVSSVAALVPYNFCMLPLAGIGLFFIYFYSFKPICLNYRGGGEILQALGVGFILPIIGIMLGLTVYFFIDGGKNYSTLLQPFTHPTESVFGSIDLFSFYSAREHYLFIPLVLFQLAAAITMAIPDVEADFRAKKKTFATILGPLGAASLAWMVILAGFIFIYSTDNSRYGIFDFFPVISAFPAALAYFFIFRIRKRRSLLTFVALVLLVPITFMVECVMQSYL